MRLAAEKISFRYTKNSPFIFEGFSIDFQPGITLIKGFSGCGKSTLLRLLAGYLYPENGNIYVPSSNQKADSTYKRKDLGFAFQQLNLLPLASVERNLQLAAGIAGLSKEEINTQSTYWLERLGLLGLRTKKPSALSGGQQQRAAMARSLIKSPTVLLLDEPTSGLDDKNTEIIASSLQEYANDQRYIVVSTHDARLDHLSTQVYDFNQYMPLDPHLETLVST